CVVGKLGRKKKTAFGARWERGREKRVLCHMMCGSVVLAKPADYLDAFERCCEDNSIKGGYPAGASAEERDLMSLLFALEDTHRAPNYGILDSAPIPQGLCFHWDNFDPIFTR
ncbi:unnamed protein product, partial [Porites lobata]